MQRGPGSGGDELGDLDLRDRRLELFRVATKAGVPEVWLMGRRILELRD